MNNNVREKSLIKVEEHNILYKVKMFFKNIFKRKDIEEKNENNTLESSSKRNESFWNSITNIENDETRLLKIQGQYRRGEIKEEDLTEEQIIALCELYDRQIEALQKSNEYRKQKILLYRQKVRNIERVAKEYLCSINKRMILNYVNKCGIIIV